MKTRGPSISIPPMNTNHLSDLWTLASGGTILSAAQAGVTEILRRRATQSTETCTLRATGRAFDAAPLFAHGSTVTVRRGGTPWFVGRVTGTPGSGDGASEESAYALSGSWWYLENLVCQQSWSLRGGAATGTLSRLVLGQRLDGTRLTSGQVLAETLQYAIDAGAPFALGVIEPAAFLPLDELRDVTCAEAIRKILRWHPDCVAWFDHATAPLPTFHCRARANLAATTLTVGQPPLAAVDSLTARPDLALPAVVLHYEANDGDTLDVLTDAAPAGATGREFGALVATIPAGTNPRTNDSTSSAASPLLRINGGGSSAPPASLAQTLYAAHAAPLHSGSMRLVERDAGGTATGPGTVLNLANAACAEWSAMRAVVVEDETRVSTGTTTVRFGPPEHLGAADLATRLGITRPGVGGREMGSPAALGTPSSTARISGRVA